MVNVMCRPNPLNYFDDSRWDDILNNIRIVAGAAKEIGCAGLIIDPEQYAGSSCFYYPRLIEFLGEDKPWEEVVVKVRERGRQFGQALSAVFPDCKILFLFGHAWVLGVVEAAELKGDHSGLEGFGYLYPAFLDGMLEGTSEGTIFIEGMEQAYSYTTARQFREGRQQALEGALKLTEVPELFRKKVRCGFGLWMDEPGGGYYWHPFDPEKNRFSPGRLQRTLNLALKHSDGYVWLWNEKSVWYVDGPLGKAHPPAKLERHKYGMTEAYRQAVREARIWPGEDTTSGEAAPLADAETLEFIDGDDLFKLREDATLIQQLPLDGWMFRHDRNHVGVKQKWYSPATSTEDWIPIGIGQRWEIQGPRYDVDGLGWHLRKIQFKDVPTGKRLYFYFHGIEETMHLWIDGRYVAAYDRGGVPNKPFAVEVTGKITDGNHTVVIRVHDRHGWGGISQPVELLSVDNL